MEPTARAARTEPPAAGAPSAPTAPAGPTARRAGSRPLAWVARELLLPAAVLVGLLAIAVALIEGAPLQQFLYAVF